jgi:Protein of unknown function (DUF3040)
MTNEVSMALDDHEQKILAEIERQFYEEDPELARAVRQIAKPPRIGVKLSAFGVFAGLVIVIGFFASSTIVAFLGFALLVGSAAALVSGLRSRDWSDETGPEGEGEDRAGGREPFRRD